MKKISILVILIMLITSILTGCNQQENNEETQSPSTANQITHAFKLRI